LKEAGKNEGETNCIIVELGGQKLDKVQPSNSSVMPKVYIKYLSCRCVWRWGEKKKAVKGPSRVCGTIPGAAASGEQDDESPCK